MCDKRIRRKTTMGKSIASKTLAIAKEREKERLKSIEEEFLTTIQKHFDRLIRLSMKWDAIGNRAYEFERNDFGQFQYMDFKIVANNAGFTIVPGDSYTYKISIPEWVKGQKRTKAQLMLYRSNMEIDRTIREEKAKARRICREVLEKIKRGDFESPWKDGSYMEEDGSYWIAVKVNESLDSVTMINEAREFLRKKNFSRLSIDTENDVWKIKLPQE